MHVQDLVYPIPYNRVAKTIYFRRFSTNSRPNSKFNGLYPVNETRYKLT